MMWTMWEEKLLTNDLISILPMNLTKAAVS